jgi:organic radical activating enzyme
MKPVLKYCEVYISNVCNYSCSNCQSLNNFAFKGHQLWGDHEHEYKLLSEKLDIEQLQIIGGEPTLNPDFEQWVSGISSLWPQTKLQISTNGSRLDKITDTIYDTLKKHKGTLWLTCHNISLYNEFLEFSRQFLDEIVSDYVSDHTYKHNWRETYHSIKETDWPECNDISDFYHLPDDIKEQFEHKIRNDASIKLKTTSRTLVDCNGVEVKIDWSQSFFSSVIDDNLKLRFNSDPVKAHDICYFKECHQLNKGKLYKCPLVSVLPDFTQQFNISGADVSYTPLNSSQSDMEVAEFVNNITQPIDQCRFCPSKYDTKHNFVGTDKKIKIVPIN